jgi:hypothetical protein
MWRAWQHLAGIPLLDHARTQLATPAPCLSVFDMGCAETASKADAAEEAGGSVASAFASTRDSLLPRPWVSKGFVGGAHSPAIRQHV